MAKLVFAMLTAFALVAFGLIVSSVGKPIPGQPRLTTMAESAGAMQEAVNAMATHADAMLSEGTGTGNQDLLNHGQHWMRDAQSLRANARMMGVELAAPASLHASPADLAAQGDWGELNRNAQSMLHDPSAARTIDIEALRWTGLSMQSEGSNMLQHGQLMNEEVDIMVTQHGLTSQAAADLRKAAQTVGEIGGILRRNGQTMIEYSDQVRKMVGR